jgi:hypothetical protein
MGFAKIIAGFHKCRRCFREYRRGKCEPETALRKKSGRDVPRPDRGTMRLVSSS